jgi:Tol biopolymer transport system component
VTPATGTSIYASWSPDGDRIAFASDFEETHGMLAVYVVDANGWELTRISPSGVYAEAPAWSPDGTALAYISGTSVHVATLSGGDAQLASPFGSSRFPQWSPDGDWIAFVVESGEGWDLYLMSSNGEGHALLAAGCAPPIAWSPDGDYLAYGMLESGEHLGLCIIRSPFNDQETDSPAGDCPIPGTERGRAPVWSSDGRYILFLANSKEGNADIYRLETSFLSSIERPSPSIERITRSLEDETSAVFAGDSLYVIAIRGRGSTWRISLLDPEGQEVDAMSEGLVAPAGLQWASR